MIGQKIKDYIDYFFNIFLGRIMRFLVFGRGKTIAKLFYIDCSFCFFYRGVLLGIVVSMIFWYNISNIFS